MSRLQQNWVKITFGPICMWIGVFFIKTEKENRKNNYCISTGQKNKGRIIIFQSSFENGHRNQVQEYAANLLILNHNSIRYRAERLTSRSLVLGEVAVVGCSSFFWKWLRSACIASLHIKLAPIETVRKKCTRFFGHFTYALCRAKFSCTQNKDME